MEPGMGMDGADPRDLMVQQEDPESRYWADVGRPRPDPMTGQMAPADPSEQKAFCNYCKDKQRDYFDSARKRGLLGMWITAYAAFHGLDPDSMSTFQTQQLGFDGDEAEMLRLCINIVRTYIQRQATMVLAQPPTLKTKVSNNDASSQIGAKLGDDILGYIFKRATQDQKLRDAVLVAGVVGTGYGHLRWDPMAGDVVQVPQQQVGPDGVPVVTQQSVKSGAPKLSIGYPWTTIQEPEEQDTILWRIARVPDNKFSLAAQYAANDPEKRKRILNAQTEDEYEFGSLFKIEGIEVKNKDACTTLHFYHARCAAMPQGRYAIILGDELLWDGPCPVPEGVPIAEMCPAKFIMTTFGYAPSWDLLSIQQSLNQIVSDQLSNVANYGRQSIAMEKGTEIAVDDVAAGYRGYFYPQGGKPPSAVLMNDIGTGPSVLQAYLHKMLDDVSGQNAASRGDPEANVKSGQFAALLHTVASEYMSYWQESVDSFVERLANMMLDMVRLYGETPFLYECTGIDNRTYVKEFTKQDIAGFRGAVVETVSPMLRNLAGRLDLHDKLKDYAPEDRAAAYAFIETGRSDEFMRDDRNSQLYIQRENERLVQGDAAVEVNELDNPYTHVPKHWAEEQALLASDNPDPQAIMRLHQHIMQHAIKYANLHPVMAALLKIPPPPVQPGTQAFFFEAGLAEAKVMIAMGTGMPPDGQGVQQPPQGPGQPGSGQPSNGSSKRLPASPGGPGGDNSSAAATPGGSGYDTSGVKLPTPAGPPPNMQRNA